MRRVSESIQTQTSFDGTQTAAHRGETFPVLQVLQEVLPLWLLQSAHEPQVRYLQAIPGLSGIRFNFPRLL